MKALLMDPVVLISAGVLVAGIVVFFWLFGKFRRMATNDFVSNPADELMPPAPDLPDIDFRAPVLPTRAPVSAPAPAPGVSKDVAERLESMSARLAEMQTVLVKQSSPSAVPGGAAAGGVGQGFSPETIEKLLKIIGNVIQQVDILQKNLNIPK